ncbi:glycosyltransferase family 2 protein [Ferrovibrio xuzhouensis]|uniref:Glycosyltransferase family 2 protein n=1 Tax=Ferrovibrio xuzhouensis TaxID=1576914 RepID=A0ABV7VBK0_9PROT
MNESAFALSIVVPVYNGATSVPVLVEALARLQVPGGLEVVLVNDNSPDNSLDVCRDLCRRNEVALTVVNLARNFGEHNAVMAGLSQARGAYVITMDDDLQNPPEEVVRLWRYASEHAFDVVYTYYAEKKHALWRNLGSRFTNWCADHLLDKPKGLYLSSFRCMSAFAAKAILDHAGPFPYVDGLLMQVTQNIGRLQVDHLPRAEGRSNYTIRRLVRLFLSMFLNFSVMPLRIGTLVGFLMAGLGILVFLIVLLEALRGGTPQGYASLMGAVLLLAGVQLIMLGLVGEYLGRLFLTINRKPQFVVRDVQRNPRAALASAEQEDAV